MAEPSKVIHVRNVGREISENDLLQFFQPFGVVAKLVMLRAKNQALLQMQDIPAAVNALQVYTNFQPSIRGKNIYVQFSSHQELTTVDQNAQARGDEPNRILLVTVHHMLYPITVEVLHQVFSPHGFVEKTVTFQKSAGFQALIQYQSHQSAISAKNSLQGRNIYDGCCQLDIQFSNVDELQVNYNNERSRDFTNPSLPSEQRGKSSQMTRGRVLSGGRGMGRGRDGGAVRGSASGRGSVSGHDCDDLSHISPRRDDSTPPPSPARYAEREQLHDDDEEEILGGLPRCRIAGDRLMPNGVSRDITKIFWARIPDEGFSWKHVLSDKRDEYFEEFQKRYRWNKAEDAAVKERFMKMGEKLYAGLVHRWKKDREKGKPDSLTEDQWKKFQAYWDKPEVVAMSAKKIANRMTDVDGDGSDVAKHVGGSSSAITRMEDLRKQKGAEPMMRKDGVFVSEHSKKIDNDVNARRTQLEKIGEEVDMTRIFLKINNMSKKQWVVDFGSATTSYINTGCTSVRASGSSGHDDDMREQITSVSEANVKLQEELATERTARIEMQSHILQLTHLVSQLIESLRRLGMSPPSPSPPG